MEMVLVGPLCSLFSSFTWAVGSATYSRLSKDHSVFAINFSRATIAFPCFLLMTFLFSGGLTTGIENIQALKLANWGWFSLSVLASYGLGDAIFFMSTKSLGVPGALAIGSCYPIWTVLAGYFFLSQKLGPGQLVGIGLTIIGILIVVLNLPRDPSSEAGKRPKISVVGVILALSASIAWATNSVAAAQGAADTMPVVANTVRMSMALVMSSFFGKVFAPAERVNLPFQKLYKVGWIFFLDAVVGSFFFLYGITHSPLAVGTTLSSLSPVISVPVAIVLGLEKFSIYRTLGVIIAGAGVCLIITAGYG